MGCPVEFLNDAAKAEFMALPDDMLAYVPGIVSLIEELGLSCAGMPYVRPLRDKLWEMRARQGWNSQKHLYRERGTARSFCALSSRNRKKRRNMK